MKNFKTFQLAKDLYKETPESAYRKCRKPALARSQVRYPGLNAALLRSALSQPEHSTEPR